MNKFLVSLVCILLVMLSISVYKIQSTNNNLVSVSDSLTIIKDKNDKLVYQLTSSEIKVSELKHENKGLYDEVKSIKDNPLVVFKTKIQYVTDTILTESVKDSSVLENGIKRYNFHWYNTHQKSVVISGTTMIQLYDNNIQEFENVVDNLSVNLDLLCTVSENKDKVFFHVKSTDDNVKINSIEGYTIYNKRNKPKRFGLSVFGGPSYGFNNKLFDFSVGVGISYDLIQIF